MRNKAAIAVVAVLVLALGGASLIGRTTESVDIGKRTESFYGQHQNGIELPAQSNVSVIAFDLNADAAEIEAAVLADATVQRWMEDKPLKKFILVKGRIINVVV